jgi:hypothetical protein
LAERVIITGEPGTAWVNETDRVRYQFQCSFIRTCAACLQYHMAIGPWWPIPIHDHCRCKQFAIRPYGGVAKPFADFREILDDMSHADQVAAMGASNYTLLKEGVVSFEEIVTRYRVRSLREVVAVNKISLKTMLDVGVKPRIAEAAHSAVHTAEAEVVRQERAKLVEKLRGAGVSQDALVDAIARGVTGRVTIVGAGGTHEMTKFVPRGPDLFAQELARMSAAAAAAARTVKRVKRVKRDGTMLAIETADGQIVVIGPGSSAFGKTYEEWVAELGR